MSSGLADRPVRKRSVRGRDSGIASNIRRDTDKQLSDNSEQTESHVGRYHGEFRAFILARAITCFGNQHRLESAVIY
jgi:hypothetical protein